MADPIEWDIRVPLASNVYVLIDILFVLLILSATLGGAILLATGFQDIYGVFRVFLLADGVLIIALYTVMGFVFLNRFQLIYSLDSEGVLVRVGEFESGLNRASWMVTGFVQRHGVAGGRVFSMINEELYVPWEAATHAVYDTQRHVASIIKGKRPVIRVYCTRENQDMVFEAIQSYLPEPEE